jgi:Type IV secretion-system coupling protein DNA-binding domain
MGYSASQAARWQAYQTRAKMSASLWKQIILTIILVWLAFTFYVVWYETDAYFPRLGHQYFWQWILGGIIIGTPGVRHFAAQIPMPAEGARYDLPAFMGWLDSRAMYHASFYTWFAHYGLRTALIPIFAGVFALLVRLHQPRDTAEHLRGLRLLTHREHRRQLNGGFVRRMFSDRSGIKLGKNTIPKIKEFEHFLATGSPGAGKSTLIRQMLKQVAARRQSAVVVDADGEFVQEFYNLNRGDIILNPLDARCPFWTPWLEFRPDSFAMDAEAMAASFVRGAGKTATERFFQDSARTLLEAAFEKVQHRSDPDGLADFLAKSRKEMHRALIGTRAAPLIDEHAAEQGTGIVSVAANATKGLFHLPKQNQANGFFCAREWARDPLGWIFLPSTEDGRAAIQSIQGVWLDCLTRWLMAAEIDSQHVWIFCDELPAMGYQNQIEQLLTRGRKRGLSVVIGFQNVAQLRSIYGPDTTITMTSAPTTKVILRCDEAQTGKWASELLGNHEIEREQMTMMAGLSNYREGINLQSHRSTEHIVTAAEVQLLKPFTGFLCVAGHDRTTIRIPERHLQRNHPAFIPRPKPNPPAIIAVQP